jgi:hypothetical protein
LTDFLERTRRKNAIRSDVPAAPAALTGGVSGRNG